MAVGKEWILEADRSLGFWHCHKLIGLWVSFLIHKLGMRRERTFIDYFLGIFIPLTSLDSCQLWTKIYRAWSPILPCTKLLQSCLTVCNPVDCALPGSSVHGHLQARILRVSMSFSRGLPKPGSKPRSPPLQADSLPSEPPGKPIPVT